MHIDAHVNQNLRETIDCMQRFWFTCFWRERGQERMSTEQSTESWRQKESERNGYERYRHKTRDRETERKRNTEIGE